MTWQLILAYSVTIPALLIAFFLAVSIFYRRFRIYHYNRQRYLAGPRHIDHPSCKCHFCVWDRG